eukprot:6184738-Pleurochrysis_carterae.AAC.2
MRYSVLPRAHGAVALRCGTRARPLKSDHIDAHCSGSFARSLDICYRHSTLAAFAAGRRWCTLAALLRSSATWQLRLAAGSFPLVSREGNAPCLRRLSRPSNSRRSNFSPSGWAAFLCRRDGECILNSVQSIPCCADCPFDHVSVSPSFRQFLCLRAKVYSGAMELSSFDSSQMQRELREASEQGATAVRWNAFLKGLDLAFDTSTGLVSGLAPPASFSSLRQALDIALEHGLLMQIVLATSHFLRCGWGGAVSRRFDVCWAHEPLTGAGRCWSTGRGTGRRRMANTARDVYRPTYLFQKRMTSRCLKSTRRLLFSTRHAVNSVCDGARAMLAGCDSTVDKIVNRERVERNHKMMTTERGIQAYLDNFIQPMLEEIGPHPALFGFLAMNEGVWFRLHCNSW